MTFTIVDIIVILFLLLGGAIGYTKGAIKTLIELFGFLGSILFGVIFAPRLAQLLMQNDSFYNRVEEIIQSMVTSSGWMENLISNHTQGTNLEFLNITSEMILGAAGIHYEAITSAITDQVIYIISFIVILIVISIAVWILRNFATVVNKIPIIGPVNKGIGFIIGMVIACGVGILVFWLIYQWAIVFQHSDCIAILQSGKITNHLIQTMITGY